MNPSLYPFYLLSTPHGEHDVPFFEWLVSTNVFNILLVAAILSYLIWRFNLFGIFDKRGEEICRDVEAVERQKEEALRHLDEVRARAKNLSAEVEEILSQARASAESLSVQILEDAKADAEKIIESSKRRIEVEQKAAAKDLERRLMEDALSDARAELSSMDAPQRKQSVESFIDTLPSIQAK